MDCQDSWNASIQVASTPANATPTCIYLFDLVEACLNALRCLKMPCIVFNSKCCKILKKGPKCSCRWQKFPTSNTKRYEIKQSKKRIIPGKKNGCFGGRLLRGKESELSELRTVQQCRFQAQSQCGDHFQRQLRIPASGTPPPPLPSSIISQLGERWLPIATGHPFWQLQRVFQLLQMFVRSLQQSAKGAVCIPSSISDRSDHSLVSANYARNAPPPPPRPPQHNRCSLGRKLCGRNRWKF